METLGETCDKTGWQIHAYCLMGNHFHLVVETPQANLVRGMKWFLGTYTTRFNRRHQLSGHLFSGRYKSLVIDGSTRGYLKTVCDYVHLNPDRAKLLRPGQRLREYRWSSWPEYMKRPRKRWKWLRTDRVLGEWAIGQDDGAGLRQLEEGMEQHGVKAEGPSSNHQMLNFVGFQQLDKLSQIPVQLHRRGPLSRASFRASCCQ